SKIKVTKIEDVRAAKRKYIVDRAKELLAQLLSDVMPDSQEISEEVKKAVRVQELVEYGPERLPCGPNVTTADDIIVVEGRADVITLLKHGIKNAIAVEGTNVPKSLVELTKMKTVTVFVDGDHGGELIIKELLHAGAEIDMVTQAPRGREVEELTKKEIHKALRAAIPVEQFTSETVGETIGESNHGHGKDRKTVMKNPLPEIKHTKPPQVKLPEREEKPAEQEFSMEKLQKAMLERVEPSKIKSFRNIMENLVGTRGAFLLDEKLNIISRLPIIELRKTLNERDDVYCVVFDGVITKKLVDMAEEKNIAYLVGMRIVGLDRIPEKTTLLTPAELGEV
ncbi:MAG TPA: toprim domain-containing protein, partial [Thermoplasmata archaeon]|nr:toprim domain-containing protein [Thermoplasmata archaeon]